MCFLKCPPGLYSNNLYNFASTLPLQPRFCATRSTSSCSFVFHWGCSIVIDDGSSCSVSRTDLSIRVSKLWPNGAWEHIFDNSSAWCSSSGSEMWPKFLMFMPGCCGSSLASPPHEYSPDGLAFDRRFLMRSISSGCFFSAVNR